MVSAFAQRIKGQNYLATEEIIIILNKDLGIV
jgi:hypothetical protein